MITTSSAPAERGRRSRRLAAWALASAVVLAAAAPISASAQINPFRGHDEKTLTDEDMQLMNAAASKLRQTDATPVGATEKWANPKSGNSGTVTLLQRFHKGDLPCQKIRHAFRHESKGDGSVFDIDVCRVASGEWKIAS